MNALPPPQPRGAVWSLRLLLAVALAYTSEVLLWPDPLRRTPGDLALMAVGYLLLAVLALDLLARFRVRNLTGAMLVVLIVALLVGLLLHPDRALLDFPRNLITRVIGGFGIMALEALGLFLALTGGHLPRYRRALLGYSAALGFYAAVWARDSHTLAGWAAAQPDFAAVVALNLSFWLALALSFALVRRLAAGVPLDALRLSERGLALHIPALTLLLFLRALAGSYTGWEILVTLVIIGLLWAVLWFERTPRGLALLDANLPPRPLAWGWVTAAAALYAAGLLLGWAVPDFDIDGLTPLSVIQLGFLAMGFLWLPVVLTAAAARALDRLERRLDAL